MKSFLRKTMLGTTALILCGGGCKKAPVNNIPDYLSALNGYFAARPNCLWTEAQQFPVKVPASDPALNAPYTVLVDQGLLLLSTHEKTTVALSKDEVQYDLTTQGRAAWSADDYQPGTGNFCYGNRSTDWIGLNSPNNGKIGATSNVVFGYSLKGVPAWAKAPAIKSAFPQLKSDLSPDPHIGQATLVNTETGWQVKAVKTDSPPIAPAVPAAAAPAK